MSILPPELDANYELLEDMHEGGMGTVYKARHRHLDEPCVIKVMHSKLNGDSAARDRFFREAKRGKQLRHHNIAEVLAFFVATDGKAYLVMEYVNGENLRELLVRQGPLDARLVVTIGVQALAALASIHKHQIVHRDISPDNLMLTTDAAGAPLVKMIDLGIAKSLEETMSLTGTGTFIGKVHYASPEQFRQNVDARSDLYSLGVVLYELATGARPILETDTMAIIAASLRDDPPRPFSETDPHGRVPPNLRTVILKAIEKRPEKRFQTADDFASALSRALAADRTTVVDSPPLTEPMTAPAATPAPVTVREPTGGFSRAAVVSAFLLVLAIAAGAIQMLRAPEVPPKNPAVTSAAAPPPPTTTLTVTAPRQTTEAPQQTAAEAIARGKRLASERKLPEAYAAFAEATKSDPRNAFAWANFGAAAALLAKPDEARAAYDRALNIDPSNWLAHYNLACLLTGSGAQDEAFQHLEVTVAQLRLQAKSPEELAAVMSSIRADEALGGLRNDSRFARLLAVD
ncbi:MAG TPA: serine/threonine-protein kinase [Thermoanaerobaculia bacterium]|nr:serine/threonine-protein kinase [Thermoanaerobaculia bacterium]